MNLHTKDKLLDCSTFEQLLDLFPKSVQDLFAGLHDVPERLDFHPEGDTFSHTKIVTERLMDTGDPNMIIAGMFHDLGKKDTLVFGKKTDLHPDGTPQAPGHENVSLKLFNQVLKDGDFPFHGFRWDDFDKIRFLIKQHMRIKQFMVMKLSKQEDLASQRHFQDLVVFSMADSMLVPWKWNQNNPHASAFQRTGDFFAKLK